MVYASNLAGDEDGGHSGQRGTVKKVPVRWDRNQSDRVGAQNTGIFGILRGLGHARMDSGGSQAGMLAGAEHHNEDEERVLDIRPSGNGDEYGYEDGHGQDHDIAARNEHEEWRAEELYGYDQSRDLESRTVGAGGMFGPETGEGHEVYEMRRMR